jgi:hypothetical protein
MGKTAMILTSKYLHVFLFPFYKGRKAKAYI